MLTDTRLTVIVEFSTYTVTCEEFSSNTSTKPSIFHEKRPHTITCWNEDSEIILHTCVQHMNRDMNTHSITTSDFSGHKINK